MTPKVGSSAPFAPAKVNDGLTSANLASVLKTTLALPERECASCAGFNQHGRREDEVGDGMSDNPSQPVRPVGIAQKSLTSANLATAVGRPTSSGSTSSPAGSASNQGKSTGGSKGK